MKLNPAYQKAMASILPKSPVGSLAKPEKGSNIRNEESYYAPDDTYRSLQQLIQSLETVYARADHMPLLQLSLPYATMEE